MPALQTRLKELIPGLRDEVKNISKNFGSKVISEVTVEQAYGGMRAVKGLICDTSEVPPDKGLIIRGTPIAELANKLPEEVFYLLCTGELPDANALADLQADLKKRATVPEYVWGVLNALPNHSHPMAQLGVAILAMERESEFRKRYEQGMKKEDYWEPMLDDCLNLIARLPEIAAGIYRRHTDRGLIAADPNRDWGANYAHMLGVAPDNKDFDDLMRLYLTLHSDHENGNVSAMTTHTVGSALSDVYYALSAGLSGLAGPLHGLANQEVLRFILGVKDQFGGAPSNEQLREFAWNRLNSGQVIPGYGHGVLRVTDPRFTAFHAFGQRVCPNDETFLIVARIFDVVPKVLQEQGKVKDPWPNVDAVSGSLLYHFGLKEFDYYTVLFGVSRALGVCAQLVISRAIGSPIVRPKSITTKNLKSLIGA